MGKISQGCDVLFAMTLARMGQWVVSHYPMKVEANHPLHFSVAWKNIGNINSIPTTADATELVYNQGCSAGDVAGNGTKGARRMQQRQLKHCVDKAESLDRCVIAGITSYSVLIR